MHRFFTEITRRGPTVLASGCLIGLAIPYLADVARPLMPGMVFIFVLGTLLRINTAELITTASDLKISVVFPVLMLVACPYLFGMVTLYLSGNKELALAVAIAVAAPPASGNAAVARMLRLDPSVSLVTALCSMALVPITAPLIVHLFADDLSLSIDPVDLAIRLAILIGGAEGAALLIRRFAHAFVANHGLTIDGVVVLALFLFALGTMAGIQQIIVDDPLLGVAMIIIAYCVHISLQVMTAVLYPGPLTLKLTMGLNSGSRNVGLLWSALGVGLSPTLAFYFACSQLPIHTMPKLLQIALPKIRGLFEAPGRS